MTLNKAQSTQYSPNYITLLLQHSLTSTKHLNAFNHSILEFHVIGKTLEPKAQKKNKNNPCISLTDVLSYCSS